NYNFDTETNYLITITTLLATDENASNDQLGIEIVIYNIPTLHHISIDPVSCSLGLGQEQNFVAIGWDDAGETLMNTTCALIWELETGDGATFTPFNLRFLSCNYVAATDGVWTLWANCSGVWVSAEITVGSVSLESPTDVEIAMNTDGTNVTLTWTDSITAGVVGYIFMRDTDPGFSSPTILRDAVPIGPTVQTFTDEGVDDNVEYYYKIGVRKVGDAFNDTVLAKSVLVMGAGMNLVGMDLPIDLIRPDIGFGPEGCKNATLEIQTQNGGVNVLAIRKYTTGGWVKYEPSQEPFTSYFNMYAKEGYFIQVSADPTNEWRVAGVVFESPQTITLGSGLNLISPPTNLIRPDGGFGPEGCKNASTEIVAQNPAVSVIMIRKYTTGGWVKYEPSQEPFTSYFNMDADKGYFIQVSADPPNEWETAW
ncbi:MAG: hypothetical protein KAT70_08145, partial [Thermoplasmata archaeon]|nr:hypothetical protein [Thermoplasmata archaeon]